MAETETFTPPPGVIKPPAAPSTYHLMRWLLLRGLGLIYLVAFGSFWGQADGLIGSEGVLPAEMYFERMASFVGENGEGAINFWDAPSLFWLAPDSDTWMHAIFAVGMVAAAFLVLGVAPMLTSFACWVCYLSVVVMGQVFLAFQWDGLLLEGGLIAVTLAPGGLLPRLTDARPVPIISIWLLRWLVFRLMFASGVLKLASGDPTWSGFTALQYHYFTQPIPNAIAWYAHQMPAWFHTIGVAITLGVEIILPFFAFGTRKMRLISFTLMTAFMIVIFTTGNFSFFEPLTLVLFICLLDDKQIRRICPDRLRGLIPAVDEPERDDIDEMGGWPGELRQRRHPIHHQRGGCQESRPKLRSVSPPDAPQTRSVSHRQRLRLVRHHDDHPA
ncbi:MAG: lipase maturation factor family protein [Planctomycetota bacterium]|jgi:hypothetical protein